jgi:hypothetical protein
LVPQVPQSDTTVIAGIWTQLAQLPACGRSLWMVRAGISLREMVERFFTANPNKRSAEKVRIGECPQSLRIFDAGYGARFQRALSVARARKR